MAIIKCPHCKKNTTSSSSTCLNCGNNIFDSSPTITVRKSYKKYIIIIIALLFMIAAVVTSYLFWWGKYIFVDKLQGLWISENNFIYCDDKDVCWGFSSDIVDNTLFTTTESELSNIRYDSCDFLDGNIFFNLKNSIKFLDETFFKKEINDYELLDEDESNEFFNAVTEILHSENVKNSLEISDPYMISSYSDSYITAKSTITNTSSETVYYVKVKANFLSESGTVIDTDWTYAVGSEGLAPYESKRFDLMIENSWLIDSVEFSILDYDID